MDEAETDAKLTEVPMWKTYRWVDWARSHGLYDEYACPRTRFIKLMGLMKLSYAPHLLDVMSGDSVNESWCYILPKIYLHASLFEKRSVDLGGDMQMGF